MNQGITRRTLLQTAFVGAAVAAFGGRAAAEVGDGVKFAKDPKNPQPGQETAHTPAVALVRVDSQSVAYGKTPAGDFFQVNVQAKHEATQAHHIFGIALYVNGKLVAEHKMLESQAEASLPTASFVQRLQTGDELLVVTSCNLHGQWGNRLTV